MFEFIRIQYVLGNLTEEQVRAFVPAYITSEEADEILKGE